jgi:hypothetical protein
MSVEGHAQICDNLQVNVDFLEYCYTLMILAYV